MAVYFFPLVYQMASKAFSLDLTPVRMDESEIKTDTIKRRFKKRKKKAKKV